MTGPSEDDIIVIGAREAADGDARAGSIDLSPLEGRVLALAKGFVDKHHVLDTRKLYWICAREITDHDNPAVMDAIETLVKKKVLFPGKSITRDEVLRNKNRKTILTLIRTEPGIYFSKLRDKTGLDSNSMLWHLKMLEQFDLVRVVRFGHSTVYFDFFSDKELDALHYILHKRHACRVFKEILIAPGLSMRDLEARVPPGRQVLARLLKACIEHGLLSLTFSSSGSPASIRVAPRFEPVALAVVYSTVMRDALDA